MGFSQAQYDAVTSKVKSGVRQAGDKTQQIAPAANKAVSHWYLPEGVKRAIIWMAEKLIELSEWLVKTCEDLLQGVFAPIAFFKVGWDWQDVKGKASNVQGSINPHALGSRSWEGTAQNDYRAAIKLQSPAAGRIKEIADSTALALYACAATGLVFYGALGAIIYQFIATQAAAIAALLSGALSLAGFLASVGDAGISAGLVWTLVGATGLTLGTQASQMGVLHGQASDNTYFPQGGHWPKATA